jgi:hypothetical protein
MLKDDAFYSVRSQWVKPISKPKPARFDPLRQKGWRTVEVKRWLTMF